MTREQTKEAIRVMQAYVDGKEVQSVSRTGTFLTSNKSPSWNWADEDFERELNAASKERDDALMMLGMYRMKSDEQNQRIKQLDEAVDALYENSYPARWDLP
jgi:hypothetical protein